MIKLGSNSIGKIYLGSNSIGKAYLGSNLVFQKGGSPSPSYRRLPDGYTELAYVRCGNSGYTAAVNTGVAGATDLAITVRFAYASHQNYAPIFGNYIDESHNCNRAILTTSSGSLYVAGGNNLATSVSELRVYQTHTLTVTSTIAYLESTTTSITAAEKTANTNSIWLGSNGSNTSPQSTINLRIYAFRIRKNGTDILNYVPAKRNYDSTIGFYDLVSNSFVTSSTSAEFIAGPDAVYSDNMVLCLNWRGGQDFYTNSWFDTVGYQYWGLSNGTRETDYYEFINANPESVSQYASLAGTLPDLGYHWKVVADIAIRTQASNPTSFIPIDFGSIGGNVSGSCSFGFVVPASTGKWDMNPKLNGTSYPSFPTENYNITPETITTSETWIRRTVTIGVRASSTTGEDEAFVNVSGRGVATSASFNPLRFNRWITGNNYLGRSRVNPSSSYKYATSCRIYSIQIFYEPFI